MYKHTFDFLKQNKIFISSSHSIMKTEFSLVTIRKMTSQAHCLSRSPADRTSAVCSMLGAPMVCNCPSFSLIVKFLSSDIQSAQGGPMLLSKMSVSQVVLLDSRCF